MDIKSEIYPNNYKELNGVYLKIQFNDVFGLTGPVRELCHTITLIPINLQSSLYTDSTGNYKHYRN